MPCAGLGSLFCSCLFLNPCNSTAQKCLELMGAFVTSCGKIFQGCANVEIDNGAMPEWNAESKFQRRIYIPGELQSLKF